MSECDKCAFWLPNKERTKGECRRYAPQPYRAVDMEGRNIVVFWPTTAAKDWCGEFEKVKDN